MLSYLKKVFIYVLETDFLMGVGTAIILFYVAEFTKIDTAETLKLLWKGAIESAPLLIGVTALLAGRYVWVAKREEIKRQDRKDEAIRENLSAKFICELLEIKWRNEYLKNVEKIEIFHENVLAGGLLDEISFSQDAFKDLISLLNHEQSLAIFHVGMHLKIINTIFKIQRTACIQSPKTKFQLGERLTSAIDQLDAAIAVACLKINPDCFVKVYEIERNFINKKGRP